MVRIKECPTCSRTYSDESLSFCLNDGDLLSAPRISNEYGLFENEPLTLVSKGKDIKRLDVEIESKSLYFGEDLKISFCRTLKIPDDGKRYPLPASLGEFPIYKVADYADTVPSEWIKHGGVFIPIYQREALFIEFYNLESRQPNIVKVATGKINAITGKKWHQNILEGEQDYVVVPPQNWLDGYKTGRDVVRQFVAMPLGKGYTVESQISGSEDFGGIQLIVFRPKEGRFLMKDSVILKSVSPSVVPSPKAEPQIEMGIGAGGKIQQKIYEDNHGADTWDENHFGRVYVHFVNSLVFRQITGLEPPETPIGIETYQKYEIPWFEVYDEHLQDVEISEELYEIKPITLIDKIKGVFRKEDFISLNISDEKIKGIKLKKEKVDDGEW